MNKIFLLLLLLLPHSPNVMRLHVFDLTLNIVRAYHKNTLSTDFVALIYTPQTSLPYTSTGFISDWKRYIMILNGRFPMFFNRLNMATTACLTLLHIYW